MSFATRLRRTVKAVIRGLDRAVPGDFVYRGLDLIFPIYRVVVRYSYLGIARMRRALGLGDWQEAKAIFSVLPYSLVGIKGLEVTYRLCMQQVRDGVQGAFVELGVARGGSASLMGRVAFSNPNGEHRDLWLFDSFEGLPRPGVEDFVGDDPRNTGDHLRALPEGSCLGTIEDVRQRLFVEEGFPEDRVHLVKGWFQDTLPDHAEAVGPVSVLRIDGDWYESTKVSLEYLFDAVVPGGFVIVDDYFSCVGCKKAVDEFRSERSLHGSIRPDGRGGCYFAKV